MIETAVLILVLVAAVAVSTIYIWGMRWASKKHDEDSLLDRLIDR